MKKDFEKGKSVDKISPLFERVFVQLLRAREDRRQKKGSHPPTLPWGDAKPGSSCVGRFSAKCARGDHVGPEGSMTWKCWIGRGTKQGTRVTQSSEVSNRTGEERVWDDHQSRYTWNPLTRLVKSSKSSKSSKSFSEKGGREHTRFASRLDCLLGVFQ